MRCTNVFAFSFAENNSCRWVAREMEWCWNSFKFNNWMEWKNSKPEMEFDSNAILCEPENTHWPEFTFNSPRVNTYYNYIDFFLPVLDAVERENIMNLQIKFNWNGCACKQRADRHNWSFRMFLIEIFTWIRLYIEVDRRLQPFLHPSFPSNLKGSPRNDAAKQHAPPFYLSRSKLNVAINYISKFSFSPVSAHPRAPITLLSIINNTFIHSICTQYTRFRSVAVVPAKMYTRPQLSRSKYGESVRNGCSIREYWIAIELLSRAYSHNPSIERKMSFFACRRRCRFAGRRFLPPSYHRKGLRSLYKPAKSNQCEKMKHFLHFLFAYSTAWPCKMMRKMEI